MITIIASTNRKNSRTKLFTEEYFKLLQAHTEETVKMLFLEDLPEDFIHRAMYAEDAQSPSLTLIQDEYVLPATKFFFVMPEYNGSYPGIIKLFLDACSIRFYKDNFYGKKAGLAGVSSGRSGNLIGMDHFTTVLNYLGTQVLPNKLPISQCETLLNESKDQIVHQITLDAMKRQVLDFIAF
ncbi:MAG: NADPH-dependent FMN reductase [Saprospiraceae bacterium]